MSGKRILGMVRPVLWEAVITLAALLILAFLMLRLEWGEGQIKTGIKVVYGLACLAGGWAAGKMTGKKRFLSGMGYGAIYFLLLVLLSLAVGNGTESSAAGMAAVFGLCAAAGTAGGMLSGFFG